MASEQMVVGPSSSSSDNSPSPPAELENATKQERVSYYMMALDELVALKDSEGHLFNDYERAALDGFAALPYESRYMVIRLFLRKQGWTRLRKIAYDEIKDVKSAAEQLCAQLDMPSKPPTPNPKKRRRSSTNSKGVEVLDLTLDSDDEDLKTDIDPQAEGTLGDLSRIAYNSSYLESATPSKVLELLSLEELQDLGKKLNIKVKTNTRKDWTTALLSTAQQATLNFGKSTFGVSYDALGRKMHQMSRVLAESLQVIGDSIRLAPPFYDLFCRLALILHRTTYISAAATNGKGKASNMTSSLLARFGKRSYPSYKVERTSVFPSRLTLVQFESALALELKMVDLLECPAPSKEERRLRWIEGVNIARDVYDDWRRAVRECKKRDQDFEYYKLRFHPGWAWTRVLHKAVRMHAALGNHAAEIEILTDLLAPDQPFRKGKRGAWADRLALVTMHYPSSAEEKCLDDKKKSKMKKSRLRRAKSIVENALKDPRTHIIFVPQLVRRLARLHRMLELDPPAALSTSVASQRKASTRVMEGTRLDDGLLGKHSIWRANDGDEVGVEELALEGYRKQGWQGRHAETGVLSMLFVLLFWDIIFADGVPGVFETPWQSEPLDLRTDAFAVSRRKAIDDRLDEIRAGKAASIVFETDGRERPKNTFAVGVRWDRFTTEEMQEIATCFGDHALAVVMKAFAEEYGHRTGGVPDLCLWSVEKKQVMFAEVKGPGDTLSETQKVWIDVLLGADVPTELCKVMTTEDKMELEDKERNKKKGRGSKRKRQDSDDEELE